MPEPLCTTALCSLTNAASVPPERRQRPDASLLYRSAAMYKWCADYIQRNAIKECQYLEAPCRDMAGLVEDKAKWLLMTNRS